MSNDYYQMNIVKEFNNQQSTLVNYRAPIYQRNHPIKYKLTLNHIELIEYFVRMIKPRNFMELGVQFGETTKRIIPHIVGDYYAVDMERTQNIDYSEKNYNNFHFIHKTTDDFFNGLDSPLALEMVFIDACHSHEATYRDFLNVKKHLVNDGIIFMHDMYPKDIESTNSGLSGDCYKTAEKIRKEHYTEFEILTIPVEPGIAILRKVDRQLDWCIKDESDIVVKEDSYGFLIASCIRENAHLLQLNHCIQSIREKHPNQKKVVVVDFTSTNELVQSAIVNNPDVLFELSTEMIPADMLLLDYYKKNNYFNKAILLQDSMMLKTKFCVSDITDITYLWYFTNHRKHWHSINEPDTVYNKMHNIITHDDLNMHVINTKIENPDFKEYCRDIYYNKNEWCGCFGTCCIITYDFLNKLDKCTNIIQLQKQMTNNRLRRSIESIFALACQYVTRRNMEYGYDGLYYDGDTGNSMEGHIISKVSFDRQ